MIRLHTDRYNQSLIRNKEIRACNKAYTNCNLFFFPHLPLSPYLSLSLSLSLSLPLSLSLCPSLQIEEVQLMFDRQTSRHRGKQS